MRNIYFALILFLFLPVGGLKAQDWQEIKGDHFIVFYKDNQGFARDVSRKSEYYYNRIASDLGYVRYSNFWQWDQRVKIFIYQDQGSFLGATGQPAWSIGNANYSKKEINSYSGCDKFLDGTLPHEIAHLIFRDFVGFKGEVPLWLDEGVAQWEEKPKHDIVKALIKQLYDQKKLLSLLELTRMDVRRIQENEKAQDFYVQAASLVGFLIEDYGADNFAQLCRELRDGKNLDDSLRFTYPTEMRNLEELERHWLKYISQINVSRLREGDRR
jgi:hypothetical protein